MEYARCRRYATHVLVAVSRVIRALVRLCARILPHTWPLVLLPNLSVATRDGSPYCRSYSIPGKSTTVGSTVHVLLWFHLHSLPPPRTRARGPLRWTLAFSAVFHCSGAIRARLFMRAIPSFSHQICSRPRFGRTHAASPHKPNRQLHTTHLLTYRSRKALKYTINAP